VRPLTVDRDRGRRHEVTAAILAAFSSDAGFDALRGRVAAAPRTDPSVHRLRAGLAAASAYRRTDDDEATPLKTALREAACLWREGLFFEAHERLEGEWRVLAGRRRSALQGVIQLAVALHHLAHGNARGAASLVTKGRAHLERDGTTLAEVDGRALVTAFARWEHAFHVGRWPSRLAPPALVLRVSSARARRPSA
jgi:hypothetical protein